MKLPPRLVTQVAERGSRPPDLQDLLHETVAREVQRLATITSSSVVAALEPDGRVYASGGTAAARWPADLRGVEDVAS